MVKLIKQSKYILWGVKMLKFISLLGTNAYLPCNYYVRGREDLKVENCRYVQKAILDILKRENIVPDKIVIFTTEEAYKNNWIGNEEKPGLREELEKFEKEIKEIKGMNAGESIVESVSIPNGTKEEDLWDIFRIILDQIEENDEIIFDITHSFRYLPMLVFIVINYARVVKKCKLNSIFYGAFEVLGKMSDVQKIPVEDRNAPIFDLTSFVDLFDWTVGIDRYLNTGDVSVVYDQTFRQMKRINQEKSKSAAFLDQDVDKKTLFMDSTLVKRLSKSMKEFSDVLFTCRGLSLTESVSKLKDNLTAVMENASKQHIVPLLPLLEMMKDRFDRFSKDDKYINVIEAAKWCADNKMYQQGLTILEEGLISYACEKLGYRDLNELIKTDNRSRAISYAYVVFNELGKKDKKARNNPLLNLKPDTTTELLILLYQISQIRNDINHAGWREDPSEPGVFEEKLHEFIKSAERIILSERGDTGFTAKCVDGNNANRGRKMLLIFSHGLTVKQKEDAEKRFGISEFVTLPSELQEKWSNIPPDLEDLRDYLRDILEWINAYGQKGDYALVQGDFGVTFITVNYCRSKGIIPLYSTTRRNVNEEKNGNKVKSLREFEHVMFREYKI